MTNAVYPFILALHSSWRWVVLIILLFSLLRFAHRKRRKLSFSSGDALTRAAVVAIFFTQVLLGMILYGLSPITHYFLAHFNNAVHMRQIRFFGMEHSSMMCVAALLLLVGNLKCKNADTDERRFRILLTWYAAALLVMLSSIPWEFSPLTSRPSFRAF